MTREEAIAFACSIEGAKADNPFERDFLTTIFRHADTGKWFGALLAVPGTVFGREGSATAINLKCPEELSRALVARCRSVAPGWHMNKRLWISAELPAEDLSDEELKRLILLSFSLTDKKKK